MNIQADIQVGALFKLIVHKGDPLKPSKQLPFFHNLVLDAGLDRLSVGSAIGVVCVGSGNSTPVATQTSLDSFIASTTQINGSDERGNQTSTPPFHVWARRTYRFREGVAAGNLSEIGIGWTVSNLFNRALIKDASGNPVTITVLSDEYLDVIVELRMYPQQTISSVLNLHDKSNNIVSTHTVTGSCFIAESGEFSLGKVELKRYTQGLRIHSGPKNAPVSASPSTPIGDISMSNSYPTPRECVGVAVVALNAAVGTHRSFYTAIQNLVTLNTYTIGYKWEIDPPIEKTNQQEITYTCSLAWGRYEPA